jgi:hypothetical protein
MHFTPKFRPSPPSRRLALLLAAGLLTATTATHAQTAAATPPPASAATASLSGRVQNAATGQFLNNVRLTVKGTNLVAFTDESGSYRLGGVPAGPAILEVFYTGMEAQQIPVSLAGGTALERDISLAGGARYRDDHEVVKLESLVVSSSREIDGAAIAINEQRFAANAVNIVAADEFGIVPDGNIGEFLKMLPGITMDYRGGDPREISMNGVPSAYVPVTIGGFSLATSETSGTGRNVELNAVSINNMSRIEANTYTWGSRRSYIDLTAEYSLTRRLALFANLRNLNDPTDDVEIAGPNTPAAAQFRQRVEFGSLWTIGVKGSF